MKITNKAGLPAPIVQAVTQDDYTRGASHISATGLLKPPRATALEIAHAEEMEDDASNRIWSLVGRIGHGLVERGAGAGNHLSEVRLFGEVLGWTLSGQFDHVDLADDGTLSDWKFTTVYKAKGPWLEWEQQLNIYLWLFAANSMPVPQRIQVVAVFRDWSKREAARNPDYPQTQAAIIPLPVWPHHQQQAFIESRVAAHQQARISLPLCTDDDRWAKPAKIAVMKKGRASALRLLNSIEEAETWCLNNNLVDNPITNGDTSSIRLKKDITLVERPGEVARCSHYCGAAPFCTQWEADPRNPKSALNAL